MPEYITDKPKAVTPGEPITIDNQRGSPVEVSAGLVFREDGDYFVSVRGGKITVRGSGEPAVRHGKWIPINQGNPAWRQMGVAQYKCSVCGGEMVSVTKRCPECGAMMFKEPSKGSKDKGGATV